MSGYTGYPIPTALYPCMFEGCRDEYSWPADELQWAIFGDGEAGWLCQRCVDDCYHFDGLADGQEPHPGEVIVKSGPLLSEVLEARGKAEGTST